MEKSDLRENVTIKSPQIDNSAFIARGAQVIGDVVLKEDSSIWYNTVARADIKENMIVGDYELVVGVPGKIIKTLPTSTYDANVKWAKKYVQLANIHRSHNEE